MTDSLLTLLFLGVLVVTAGATGRALLRRLGCTFGSHTEEACFACAAGLGALMVAVLAMGVLHLLYVWAICLMLVGWILLGARQMHVFVDWLRRRLAHVGLDLRSYETWLALLTAAAVLLLLVRALAPPHGATDPLAYQMALPKTFLRKHYLSFEPTVTGALYPSNMGLLYVVALALQGGPLAQGMHWLMAAMSLAAVVGFASRYFTRAAGVWGAAIFACMPVVTIFGPLGYVDVGLCFFQFMAFWALLNWAMHPHRGMLLLAACLAGVAMGTKHQGMATPFVGTLAVLGVALWRRQSAWAALGSTGLYAGVALLLCSPWYVRAYLEAGNPVWPLANRLFGGAPFRWAPQVLANTSGDPGQTGLGKLLPSTEWVRRVWDAISPWAWTFSPGGWQKAIGPHFLALLPAAALQLAERRMRWLLGFCGAYYLLLVRVLHANPRYGLVLFAFLAVACGHAGHQLCAGRLRPGRLLVRAGFVASILLSLAWGYALAADAFAVALGRQTASAYLRDREPNYRAFQYVNTHLPASARVLLQGIVEGFYCERDYLWDHPYQATVDYSRCRTPEDLREHLRGLGVSHIMRMIRIPPYRKMYPQYFEDPLHEAFRRRYLRVVYRDESFVVFEVDYDGLAAGS
ncbi:MAG: hypothetical protein AB1505_31550 [Candidatus Latescibacterota bacterium]